MVLLALPMQLVSPPVPAPLPAVCPLEQPVPWPLSPGDVLSELLTVWASAMVEPIAIRPDENAVSASVRKFFMRVLSLLVVGNPAGPPADWRRKHRGIPS